MNIQDIQLDINKSPSVGEWVTIGQGDKGGTTIRATVYDNGAAAALAGMSARFEMRMPNATYFEDTNCTVSGNVITYVVDESHAALYAGGGSEAYFALHDGDTAIYSTERFHVRVARAASDGANPGRAWTNGIQEWLDDASDTLDDAVADANSRVGATINAANAAVEGMRSDVDGAIDETEDVIGRAESAIDAMGDISELAVPLMSKDVRGGAKLEEHGGLVLRDEKLGIGNLVQESDGAVRGGLAEVTAKGHAEQDGTPTPENPVEIQVVRGRNLLRLPDVASTTSSGKTFSIVNGLLSVSGTSTGTSDLRVHLIDEVNLKHGTTYTIAMDHSLTDMLVYLHDKNENTYPMYWVLGTVGTQVFTPSEDILLDGILVRTFSGNTTVGSTHIQLTLGSTAHPYVPYGHVGLEVQGKNLWTFEKNAYVTSDGTIGNAAANAMCKPMRVKNGESYVIDCHSSVTMVTIGFALFSGSTMVARQSTNSVSRSVFEVTSDGLLYAWVNKDGQSIGDASQISIQLEKGSTATEYEPYYHSTTPIPLPQRGWVAGLPDGTADVLMLDGAGKVTWMNNTEEVDLSSLNWSYRTEGSALAPYFYSSFSGVAYDGAFETTTYPALFEHFIVARRFNLAFNDGCICFDGNNSLESVTQIQAKAYSVNTVSDFISLVNGSMMLYHLATPITEDMGYVEDWPTDIPEGATVTIPELDEVGIKYFIDSSVTELAKQWYARANSEYKDRLQALEEAMATIITNS